MRLFAFKISLLVLAGPALAQKLPQVPASSVDSHVSLSGPQAVAVTPDVSTYPTAKTEVGKFSSDVVCLNPQTLPPRDPAIAGATTMRPGERMALNPQPLPPRDPDRRRGTSVQPGGRVALNPQPLPPREARGALRQGC